MSPAPVESQGWPRQRWLVIIGLVLGSQVALIFWLAGHGAEPTTAHVTPPRRVYLPGNSAPDSPGGSDPLIFVRPNLNGFSGPAWMKPPQLSFNQPKWTDSSPPTNSMRVQQLGGVLNQFLQTNPADGIQLAPKPEPELPVVVTDDPLANVQSTLTFEGELASRQLRQPLTLAEWPATETTEILSNSVVQAGVDMEGNVFSAVLVAGSGSKDADASALLLARRARFEPMHRHGAAGPDTQTWGQFVFHWHTVAAPVTNNSTLKP